MTVRVYLPATLGLLAEWDAAGEVPASADRLTAPDEDEESEYLTLMSAADASAGLLDNAGRRVVVVAETAGSDGTVAMDRVVAVHADIDDFTDPDDDLAWFASQEIPDLVRAARG